MTLSNEFLIKLAELDYKYQFMNVPIFKILRGVLSPAYINNIFNSLTIVSKILKNYRVENFYLTIKDSDYNQIDISILINDILLTKFKKLSTNIKKLTTGKNQLFIIQK